jgi:hypothetical protein
MISRMTSRASSTAETAGKTFGARSATMRFLMLARFLPMFRMKPFFIFLEISRICLLIGTSLPFFLISFSFALMIKRKCGLFPLINRFGNRDDDFCFFLFSAAEGFLTSEGSISIPNSSRSSVFISKSFVFFSISSVISPIYYRSTHKTLNPYLQILYSFWCKGICVSHYYFDLFHP